MESNTQGQRIKLDNSCLLIFLRKNHCSSFDLQCADIMIQSVKAGIKLYITETFRSISPDGTQNSIQTY